MIPQNALILFFIFLGLWLVPGHTMASVESNDNASLLEEYEAIKTQCDRSTVCIQDVIAEKFSPSIGESCAVKMQRAALLTFNNTLDDPIFATDWFDLSDCDTNFVMLRYNLGLAHFHAKEYREAQRNFVIASELAPLLRSSCLSNAGSCAANDGRMEEAVDLFEQAFYSEEEANVMLLNNLSAINITLRDYEKSMEWADMADLIYSKLSEDDAKRFPKNFQQLVDYNRLKAAIGLGDTAKSKLYWKKIDWTAYWMSERQTASIIVDYARLTDDLPSLLFQLERIGMSGIQRDSTFAYSDPLMVLLLDSTTAAIPAGQRLDLWPELTRLFPLDNGHPGSKGARNIEKGQLILGDGRFLFIWWFVFLVVLCVNFYLGGLLWRSVKHHQLTASHQRDLVFSAIKNRDSYHALNAAAQGVFKTIFDSMQTHSLAVHDVKFNDTERIVFHEAVLGAFPKETAAKFDWSPSYVYSTRTAIRQKLGLPAEMTFRTWKSLNPEVCMELFGSDEILRKNLPSDAE